MDLAKVGEVWETTVGMWDHDRELAEVNRRLGEGWVLVSVKCIDKDHSMYILGKPRPKLNPKAVQRNESGGPTILPDKHGQTEML
jgi:hypothetical protein